MRFAQIIKRLSIIFNGIGVSFLVALMLLTVVDVFLRKFFNSPILGTMEFSEFMLVLVIWLGMSYTMVVGGHVKIDMIVERLSARIQLYFDILAYVVGLGIIGILAWITLTMTASSWQMKEYADISKWPLYPFKGLIFLGAAIMWFELLAEMLVSINKIRTRQVNKERD